MSEILDNIVNCKISIEALVEDGASFGIILLVGNAPVTARDNLKDVSVYASLPEVMAAGWKEDSEMYKAASAAFMQDPKPEHIYIAVRKREGRATVTMRFPIYTKGKILWRFWI